MRHADFANLIPSEARTLIEAAVADLPWNCRLVSFTSGISKQMTYATVARDGVYADEVITYLVCPQTVGPRLARTMKPSGHVILDNGHYGFTSEQDATADMYARANR